MLRYVLFCSLLFYDLADSQTSTYVSGSISPSSISASQIRSGVTISVAIATYRGGTMSLADSITIVHLSNELRNPTANMLVFGSSKLTGAFNDRFSKRSTIVSEVKRTTTTTVTLLLSDPDYYAYEDETIYFQFLIAAYKVNNTNGPIALPLSVAESTTTFKTARQIINVIMAYFTLIITYGSTLRGASVTTVLTFPKISLIGRIAECGSDLDYILHMTQLSILPSLSGDIVYFGALIMNMSIFMIVLVVHWVYTLVTTTTYTRDSIATLFPSSHFYTAAFALGGLSVASFDLIITSNTPLRFVLGIVVCLIFFSGLLGAGYKLAKQCHPSSARSHDFLKTYGHTVFAQYKPETAWYLVVELGEVILIGATSAFEPSEAGPSGCQLKGILTLAIVIVNTLVLLLVRPYRRTFDFVFGLGISVGCIILAGFVVMQAYQSSSQSFPETVTELLQLVIALAVLTKTVLIVWRPPFSPEEVPQALGAPLVDKPTQHQPNVYLPGGGGGGFGYGNNPYHNGPNYTANTYPGGYSGGQYGGGPMSPNGRGGYQYYVHPNEY